MSGENNVKRYKKIINGVEYNVVEGVGDRPLGKFIDPFDPFGDDPEVKEYRDALEETCDAIKDDTELYKHHLRTRQDREKAKIAYNYIDAVEKQFNRLSTSAKETLRDALSFDGVFAYIKALCYRLREKDRRIAELEKELERVKSEKDKPNLSARVCVRGRVIEDPTIKALPSGTKYCRITIETLISTGYSVSYTCDFIGSRGDMAYERIKKDDVIEVTGNCYGLFAVSAKIIERGNG